MTEAQLLADIETLGWTVDGTITGDQYQTWIKKIAQCYKTTADAIEFRDFIYCVPEGGGPTDPAYYLGQDPTDLVAFDGIRAYCDGLVTAETFDGYVIEHYDSASGSAVVVFFEETGGNVTEARHFVDDDGGYQHRPII